MKIEEFQSEFFRGSSSFQAERLRIKLGDGAVLRVFFKDLSPRSLLEVERTTRAPGLRSSRLEWRMYRQVLCPERLGTPQLYASLRLPSRGILWLFLEDIAGSKLKCVSEFEVWLKAARWAARFHVYTRGLPASRISFLPRFDRAHFERCARRVARRLAQLKPEERSMIRLALEEYETIVGHLTTLPQSVIHGEFFGPNILIRRTAAARRVAVVDWESAAIGPSFLDLANISSGGWPERRRRALWRAYFEEYQAQAGLSLDWDEFCRDLADTRLYQALMYLLPTMRRTSIRSLIRKRNKWLQEIQRLLAQRAGRRS